MAVQISKLCTPGEWKSVRTEQHKYMHTHTAANLLHNALHWRQRTVWILCGPLLCSQLQWPYRALSSPCLWAPWFLYSAEAAWGVFGRPFLRVVDWGWMATHKTWCCSPTGLTYSCTSEHIRHFVLQKALERVYSNGDTYFKLVLKITKLLIYPGDRVHGANMGPTWVLTDPDRPHVGPMNLAIRVVTYPSAIIVRFIFF